MSDIFFTPGPAQLYPSYRQHLLDALDRQIGSISHRSRQFRSIFQETTENLRTLLGIPADTQIFFTGTATEVWERSLQNCVATESFHLVNGSFSKKFYEFATALGKHPLKVEVPAGQGFDIQQIHIPETTELVCLTHNETSFGVMMPAADIHALKKRYPAALFIVDMVSSAPYPDLDYSLIDFAFFSVQKGFGMPAGLGVWIANEKCLAKAEALAARQLSIGTFQSLPVLWKNAQQFETPATPNVMGIYILGKIVADMLKTGIATIRQETEAKAALLYDFLDNSETAQAFVQHKAHRSQTVIVANVPEASGVMKKLAEKNLIVGSGYGSHKEKQIRIANFPATTPEQIGTLLTALKELV